MEAAADHARSTQEPEPEPELEPVSSDEDRLDEDGEPSLLAGNAELRASRMSPRDVSKLRMSTAGSQIDIFERFAMLNFELKEGDDDEGGIRFTIYKMRCFTKDDRAWDVQKRFREFLQLREMLIANGEDIGKLKFPRRVLWGATDQKVVEKRMVGLQAWLGQLLDADMQSVRHLSLLRFLSCAFSPCAWTA